MDKHSIASSETLRYLNSEFAQRYAEMGWSVIPISPVSKKPLTEWKHLQSRIAEPEEIDQWWAEWPDAEVGVITGEISGIVVIDCDNDDAIKSVAEREITSLVRQKTRRGCHLFFKHPGYRVKNAVGWQGLEGVDVRGDGGYAKVYPSKNYEWDLPGIEIEDIKHELKEWQFAEVAAVEELSGDPVPETATIGQRNTVMTRLTGQLIHKSQELWGEELAKEVWKKNREICQPPLSIEEIKSLVTSVMFTHMRNHPNEFKRIISKEAQSSDKNSIDLICASHLTPEPVHWLWDGYLAKGKIHILGGPPGTGKTTIALSLAANLSSADVWPDSTKSPLGRTVIWSGEDDPKDTILPRLIAAGANLEKISIVGQVTDLEEKRPFDPARDIVRLTAALEELDDVALLIIDPVVSAVRGDGNSNVDVRRSLQPLADLAEKIGCAVVGITHFTKGTQGSNPVERITGSLAFGALARVVLIAAKGSNKEDPDQNRNVFMRAKSNIGPDGGGFNYELKQIELSDHQGVRGSVVGWGDPILGTAQVTLAEIESAPSKDEISAQEEAELFLREVLSGGSLSSSELSRLADEDGISKRTLQRACRKLKVTKNKSRGPRGEWLRSLPPDQGES